MVPVDVWQIGWRRQWEYIVVAAWGRSFHAAPSGRLFHRRIVFAMTGLQDMNRPLVNVLHESHFTGRVAVILPTTYIDKIRERLHCSIKPPS